MVKVGGEVDAFCGKCELTLAHTVHAMVGSTPGQGGVQHLPRRAPLPARAGRRRGSAGARRRSARPARPAREKKVEITFEELLASSASAAPVPYSPKRTFAVDDVVDHPTFGRGFVTAVRDGKVEITFRSDVKTLVHGRG